MKQQVTLYTLSTCPTCKRVKRFLEERNVGFTQIEVDLLEGGEQWLASKEVKRHNPAGTYPTLVVEDVIVGFDEQRLKDALRLP
ncbi:MAG TPA: glutaredoxin family protein [Dissulfurispiraceae bacterium]|nr:glutaredoxin family protein [Dissulfurispiraceae bacterium]